MVVLQHDEEALRELLRQRDRMLQVQQEARESAHRRTAELMRLAVASLGGVVIVGGLLSAAGVVVDGLALALSGLGVAMVTGATLALSIVLVGWGSLGDLALGPDLFRIVEEMEKTTVHRHGLFVGLVRALPDLIRVNERSPGSSA